MASEPIELYLYDQIGPDWAGMISDKLIVAELAKIGNKRVRVRINSPGGDVFIGKSIYNAFLRHAGGVDVEIDSIAASAASLVAMAGQTIRIAENARVMIHRAWTIAGGNAGELRGVAELLESEDKIIGDTYAARTKQSRDQIEAWLDGDPKTHETWMTAQEAVDRGFADEIGQRLNVKACVKGLKNLPQGLAISWDDVTTAAAEASRQQPPTRQASIYSPEHIARVIDLRKRALL